MSKLACALLVVATGTAAADTGGNVDLSGFRPAMDSRGYLTVNASQVLGDKEVSFGLGALDWGHGLLKFDNGAGTTYSVDNIITATLVGAFGIHAGPLELEFGASVPFKLMTGDITPDRVNQPNPNDDKNYKIDGQGIGTIGLHLKTRFLKTSKGPHVGLGLVASAYIGQTTSPRGAWLGENTVVPEVMGILDKEFGREARLRIALNAGIRLRSGSTFINDDGGKDLAPVTGRAIAIGNELPFGGAISYAVSKGKFDVIGEVIGSVPLGTHDGTGGTYQPLEALGGIKVYLARNSFLSLGGGRGLLPGKVGNPDARAFISIVFEPNIGDRDGDGIKDDVDKCPDDPEDFDGFEDEDGCPDPDNDRDGIPDVDDKCPNIPEDKDGVDDDDGCPEGEGNDRDNDGIPDNVDKCPDDPEDFDGFQDDDGCPDPDNDGDGILDVDDLCPNDPEDKDGFEDEDGCPDPDNDHDRILDKDDKCPNEPENYNGYQDDDGCPDRSPYVDVTSGIVILKPINFEYDKDVITTDSYPILDAVAATLQGNPDISLVEVQGHTDERGDDNYNLDLSDRRAHAVVKYLIGKQVDDKRLTAQGYGETQPKNKAHTAKAWAENRRVEFIILKRTGELTP